MVWRPSSSIWVVRPKASLPFWEPAMDWNIRSSGAPNLLAASVWVVTWASTQIWVGTSHLFLNSSSIFSRRATLSTESSTGLMPMTASPQPRDRPSITEATTPLGSSVVWLGWRRAEKVPGRPMVVLQCALTRIFLAAYTRSRLLISLHTPAMHSEVRPREARLIISPVVFSLSSHSRNSATVIFLKLLKMVSFRSSWIMRVTSSSS